MKIIAVRSAHLHPQFQPTIHLGFDPVTSDLSVSLYLPTQVRDDAANSDAKLTLVDTMLVDINALRKRYDWCDHQAYFVAVHEGKFLPVLALYPQTLPNREEAVDYARRIKSNLLVGLNVPFASATDDELFITVNLNAQATGGNIQVDENCTLLWSDAPSSAAVRSTAFPGIAVHAPASVVVGGSASIELRIEDVAGQLLDQDAIVYIEAVAGLVPFTRVRTRHGLASVPVSAAGISAGDEIRVKFGWKYFAGANEARIAVVAL